MLNRAALICHYKQPFVDWINAVDPSPTSHTLTLAEVNEEHTVYLVEVEDENELERWLVRHHAVTLDVGCHPIPDAVPHNRLARLDQAPNHRSRCSVSKAAF